MSTPEQALIRTWARPLRPPENPQIRLYCLPFAGGGLGSFQSWPAALAPDIEVCPIRLPGREARMAEPSFVRVEPLVDVLKTVVEAESRRPDALPFAIFGHSMGAVIAFELCHALAADVRPRRLVVSGRFAPTRPSLFPSTHHLTDDELLRTVTERYNGIPKAILDVPEMLELILPPLRADMELVETYRYRPRAKLELPITALGGDLDTGVPLESVRAWSELTDGPFDFKIFEGDHFFIQSRGPEVAEELKRALL